MEEDVLRKDIMLVVAGDTVANTFTYQRNDKTRKRGGEEGGWW